MHKTDLNPSFRRVDTSCRASHPNAWQKVWSQDGVCLSAHSPAPAHFHHPFVKLRFMRQIEKMLKEMQTSGKDLSRLKLKKFQKTHHIDCKCKLCENAKTKNDLRLRGLLEDGFKVYVAGEKKNTQ